MNSGITTAAVVGTGFIGPVHVEALKRIGVRVKGILGSSAEKSAAAAGALGLEVGYANYEALLADPDVRVVHLTSPNRFHHRQVLQALESGRHVVCEKPLGMTTAETRELVAAAERVPDLVCAVNYNIRFYPINLHARAMIASGELGQVLHVKGSYMQDWLLYPSDFNWRVLASEGGDLRAIGDIGTHWLDLIGFISGLKVVSVMADLHTVHDTRHAPPQGSTETFGARAEPSGTTATPVTTEDYASVLLRFKGGARGVMTVSQVTAGRKNAIEWEIAGSQKALAWHGERPNELWVGERDEANRVLLRNPGLMDSTAASHSSYPAGHNEGFPDTFKQLHRAIYADITAGKRSAQPLYATFADGHEELCLCEAILESHQRQAWVNVQR